MHMIVQSREILDYECGSYFRNILINFLDRKMCNFDSGRSFCCPYSYPVIKLVLCIMNIRPVIGLQALIWSLSRGR